ncbi:MAG TPA: bifunctional UDP-sugar hydrolase/5'-nucleotidase [Bacteroidales bacterium]|nr:bifunctional UDP-sugar hydrolase/5'-nucleotidase [Bacteroidales bacterium]
MLKFRSIKWIIAVLLNVLLISCSKTGSIKIIETTDLHGMILPFDFIENESSDASLANVSSYIQTIRNNQEQVVLLDDGDNLQGQPVVYYYNFIDTVSDHILAGVFNYLKCDAVTAGNHDFEAGHPVYDRIKQQYDFPLLAANAVDVRTGEPYFKPYTIVNKGKFKIAVFGLVTPSIPEWLPPRLYSGIKFEGMVETARKWMPEILKQKPDLVVGLFHSGFNREEFESRKEQFLKEDGSAAVAYNVPGFDIILNGHDHKLANEKIVNADGDTVLMMNAGSRCRNIAEANVVFSKGHKKVISGKLIEVSDLEPDKEYISHFEKQSNTVHEYVDKVIGNSESTLSSRSSYFGPSAFISMVHKVQLEISGADVSFTAPLSFDVRIEEGPIKVSDMFKLYRYENMLYTMSLTGSEIKKYLEYSYGGWMNTMKGPAGNLLKFRTGKDGKPVVRDGKAWLDNQPYNFDSAEGIDYVVDVSKPEGERITISGLTGGKPFEMNTMYKVAVNSYRGSGGGGHLTEGVGLSQNDLAKRLITSTDKDLRFYILKYIESQGNIKPQSPKNWKIVPETWAKAAAQRDYALLFGEDK